MQQRSYGRLLFALCTALAVPLTGCGGGSNNVYQAVSVPATPTAGTATANAGPTSSSASFTTTSGVSGTITVPAASSGSAKVSFVTSTTPPQGVPVLAAAANMRRPSDTTASAGMLYVSATFGSTIVLPSLPAFSFGSMTPAPNTQYFLAFFDPSVGKYAAKVEGPATVGGSTLSFTAPAGSVTFTGGTTYVFALYGVTLAPITVDHAALTFSALGAAGAQTFTPSEARYTGAFSATSANPAIATVSGPNSSGAFTVTAVSGGTTTITVTDAAGQTATISVSVTTGTFIPQ